MKNRSKKKTKKYLHAVEQHRATVTLLKHTRIVIYVQNAIPKESRVLFLFEILSNSTIPVPIEKIRKEIKYRDGVEITDSAISQIKDELNTVLHHFSRKHDLLKRWNIIIEIPTKKPSEPRFGYYFACKKFKRKKYIDEDRILSLLKDIQNEEITDKYVQILSLQAKESFSEKLYDRVKDYQPLDMEVIEIDERLQDSDRRLVDYQSNESRKNDIWTWKRFDPKLMLDPKTVYIISMETGGGKTTFLRYLQIEFIKDKRRIPIYIDASELEKWDYTCMNSFLNCLAIWIGPQIAKPKEIILQYLKDTFEEKILLLVDGLDQIGGVDKEYKRVLNGLLKVCSNNLIVASRPTAVVGQETNPDVKFLRLISFSESSQKEYFDEYYERAYKLCESDLNLLAVPMLAYMVRTLIEENEDVEIENRTSLYKRFIKYILFRSDHGALGMTLDERLTIRKYLQEVSYYAMKDSMIQTIPAEFCWNSIQKYKALELDRLPKYGLVNLIIGKSGENVCFTHQSFQEYLAAEWISQDEEKVDNVLKEYWNPKWREVIKFLTGMLGETVIAKIYSGPEHDTAIHSRLFMAAECGSQIQYDNQTNKTIVTNLVGLVDKMPFHGDAVKALVKLGEAYVSNDYLWTLFLKYRSSYYPCRADSELFDALYSERNMRWVIANLEGNKAEFAIGVLKRWVSKLNKTQLAQITDMCLEAKKWYRVMASVSSKLEYSHVERLVEKINEDNHYEILEVLKNTHFKLETKEQIQLLKIILKQEGWCSRHVTVFLCNIVDDLDPCTVDAVFEMILNNKSQWVSSGEWQALMKFGAHLNEKQTDRCCEILLSKFTYVSINALYLLAGAVSPSTQQNIKLIFEFARRNRLYFDMIRAITSKAWLLDQEHIDFILEFLGKEDSPIKKHIMGSMRYLRDFIQLRHVDLICAELNRADLFTEAVAACCYVANRLTVEQRRQTFVDVNIVRKCDRSGLIDCYLRLSPYLDCEDCHIVYSIICSVPESYIKNHYLALLNPEKMGPECIALLEQILGQDDPASSYWAYLKLRAAHEKGHLL